MIGNKMENILEKIISFRLLNSEIGNDQNIISHMVKISFQFSSP